MLLFLTLLWVGRVTAQVTETTEGGDIQQTLNAMFQNVNTSTVPYGLLMSKSIYFDNIHKYNGVTISDSTDVNINTFGWLYSMLGMAQVGANTLPAAETLYGENAYTEGAPVPLVVMCERYGHFKSTAFDDNLMRYDNNQLFDVSGRTEDPYTSSLVFVASPIVNKFKTGNISFVLPSNRIIRNFGTSPAFSIDFGSGFRSIRVGEPFSVSLPVGTTRAVMQLQVTNGRLKQRFKCRFEIEVAPSIFNAPVPESGGLDEIYSDDNLNSSYEPFWETRPEDGTNRIRADVTTFYACSDKKLRKPLLILDGFNTGTKDNVNLDGIVAKDFLDFFNTYTNTPIALNRDRPITKDLRLAGYDLIFVSWTSEEGRDDLRRSAALLQKLLAQINSEKARNGSTEKNAIIGLSMGGVVAKYALLDLERKNPNAANGGHDVKLFIGYDSPMQGANIPLGFQYLIKDLGDQVLGGVLGRNVPTLKGGLKTLKSSAARQLLTYQAFDANPKFPIQFTSFYNELNGMGRLQKCDYKTVSNGSMVGTPNFPAGKQLLGGRVYIPIAINVAYYLDLDVKALPATSQNFETIYKRTLGLRIVSLLGRRDININTRNIVIKDLRPLDGAPGGTTGLTGGVGIDLKTLGNINGGKYDDGNREDLKTTFIPTVSALDIKSPQGDNVFLNVSNEQALVDNQVVGSNGMVGSRSNSQSDVATEIGLGENRIANQAHVGLSYRTTGFLLYNLVTKNPLETSANVTLNNRTYNFGINALGFPLTPPSPGNFQPKALNNIIDYTLNVTNTGQLWVNRSGKIGFTDDMNAPTNADNSAYSLIIQQADGCKSSTDNALGIVNVGNNGIVRVGDGATNNPTTVRIRSGGTLRVQNLGTLIVERSATRVDVENGGQLIVEMGGNLNLTGLNTKIIVKTGGKMIINGGANINLTGLTSSIVIEQGGELVINGTMNFTGIGCFQFDIQHVLTLNSDFILRGSGKTNTLIKLTDAPGGTVNKMVISGRSVNISNALVSYGVDCQIEITNNNATQTNTFFNVGFDGVPLSSKALKFINSENINIIGGDFSNLTDGIVINGNASGNDGVYIGGCNFTGVGNGISAKDISFVRMGQCNFNYASSPLMLDFGTACKVENGTLNIENRSIFQGNFNGNRWGNYKAIELINATMNNGNELKITDFKTGIDATIGDNNILLWESTEIIHCETGINFNRPTSTATGRIDLHCTRLVDNMTGIKGQDVYFGSGDGRTMAYGNEFKNLDSPNSLLFDIFYPGSIATANYNNFTASNNFWSNGFNNTKFNLITGLCTNCTTLFSHRLRIEQCAEATAFCAGNWVQSCCGRFLKSSDGLNPVRGEVVNCATGGSGGSDALVAQKPNNPSATKADNDNLKIYPNPATETVKLDIEVGNYTLKVLNTVGQTIFEQNTEGSLSVNVATWTNGIYLFEVTNKATNKRQRSKIVVQH